MCGQLRRGSRQKSARFKKIEELREAGALAATARPRSNLSR
jgi:hypothetical protein